MTTAVEPVGDAEFAGHLSAVGVSGTTDLPPVPVSSSSEPVGSAQGARQTVERVPATVARLRLLIQDFESHLDALAVQFDAAIVVDLLASYLSTQFLLFAGSSGTGKSTAASALQTFFAPADSRERIDGRRQLIGPEDLAGYLSPLAQVFVPGPDLQRLRLLARPGANLPSPALLVEEVNLSPPEGFMSPFIHGLSGVSNESVSWRLFGDESGSDTGDLPAVLHFSPYPRLLGTINVDATSMAPAPKVAARACVILLEPVPTTNLDPVWTALAVPTVHHSPSAEGAPLVGDPLLAVRSPEVDGVAVRRECARLAAAVEYGQAVVDPSWAPTDTPVGSTSRRQFAQMLTYTAWFQLLGNAFDLLKGNASSDHTRAGAENAVLHFLLPTLPANDFADGLEQLSKSGLTSNTTSPIAGLLQQRIERLRGGGDQLVGRVLDFWDRLS